MRTIPEIVAEMKTLIAELEQHTGLPPKKEDSNDIFIDLNVDGMDVMAGAQPVFSHYENMAGDVVIDLSYPGATTTAKI